ncbi:GGDEF domain-containing protein [Burkholderia sp. 8Y]|uniref:GGDEF domain-containing protein n=1 Tax=Burkholderia sp. 8Y TaxID=2653133 RepID=UPI0013581C15|nr:GGDEF domain-containing protein [Burkholderia sp. 8Y]
MHNGTRTGIFTVVSTIQAFERSAVINGATAFDNGVCLGGALHYDAGKTSLSTMGSAPTVAALSGLTSQTGDLLAFLQAWAIGSAFVAVYDDSDHVRYANDGFLRAFNVKLGEVATFESIILGSFRNTTGVRIDAQDPISFIADAQLRRRPSPSMPRQRSFPVDFMDGSWFWCTETLLPNGWIVLIGSDITSLKQTERELAAARDSALTLSQVDELTGVANRRFTLSKLGGMLKSVGSEMTHLSVALLDLDHFKTINDTFGHETGDIVLRHFAKHCVSSVRAADVVGRLGGEEFAILLPGITSGKAKVVLDRILATIPPVTVKDCQPATIALAFSAGVAEAYFNDRPEEVLARADKALYAAKHAGRNRVEVSHEEWPLDRSPDSV